MIYMGYINDFDLKAEPFVKVCHINLEELTLVCVLTKALKWILVSPCLCINCTRQHYFKEQINTESFIDSQVVILAVYNIYSDITISNS